MATLIYRTAQCVEKRFNRARGGQRTVLRHDSWTELQKLQTRTEAAMDQLLFPIDGTPTTSTPFADMGRSRIILEGVTDTIYRHVWRNAIQMRNLEYLLQSNRIAVLQIPALRPRHGIERDASEATSGLCICSQREGLYPALSSRRRIFNRRIRL